ncbi:MAG: hypothetical protein H6810_01430 [Phycisphaeraceae bacterium]|nr:MAG: hypothetical protein H6810_01430 [Phycisphaeraceae bacterium]
MTEPTDIDRGQIGAERPGPREPGPVLSDLAAQLLFPRIFRAGPAAARPSRVLVAGIGVLVVGLVAVLFNGDPRGAGPGLLEGPVTMLRTASDGLGRAVVSLDLGDLHERVRLLLLETPRQMFQDAPAGAAVLLLTIAVVWALCGAFIARGAALELGRHVHVRATLALRFVLVKGPAAVATFVFVPVAALVLLAVPAVLGLLLAAPGLDVLGALLHGVGLIASLVAAFLLVVWLAAAWLMVPAVACDGSDAFDATQRALGIVLSRPISVGLHLALAVLQGLVLVSVVWAVADLGTSMAFWAAGLFTETGAAIAGAGGELTSGMSATTAFSVRVVALWHMLPMLVTISYAVSYSHTAGVAVYLNARQMVDGQEPNEIWMPGGPAGTTASTDADETV